MKLLIFTLLLISTTTFADSLTFFYTATGESAGSAMTFGQAPATIYNPIATGR